MNHSEINALFEEIEQINFPYILRHRLENPHTCIYCGQETPENRKTRDHIIPKIRANNHTNQEFREYFGNLNKVCACWTCNQLKGSSSLKSWAEWLRTVNRPNRILILSNLKKLMA